jgi:hypothetical protein
LTEQATYKYSFFKLNYLASVAILAVDGSVAVTAVESTTAAVSTAVVSTTVESAVEVEVEFEVQAAKPNATTAKNKIVFFITCFLFIYLIN